VTTLARPSNTDEIDETVGAAPPADRWFGHGRSTAADAREAGIQATAAALEGRTAALVIVFCPVSMDLPAMLDGVRSQTGDVPLIGCTGIAQYAADGPIGPAVVVSALGGDGFQIVTSVARDVSAGQRAAGERVAASVAELNREHSLLLLICDGLAGEQHELVRGAYSVVGATVPLAGGCAADDLTYELTSQFFADADGVHVLTDAVVAAAIGSDAPMGVGVAHGWRKVGEPMLVTDSTGGTVRTLDGLPALDVFVERVGASRDALDDALAFRLFALNHPLGMSRRSGEDIRVIHGGNRDDGSITCLADVAQGTLLWTMESDPAGLIATVDAAYDEAVESLSGTPALGFLAFDCGVRFLFLGVDGTRQEVDRLVRRTGDVPLAGFYTFGEIARTHGARGLHHLTLVLVAFS
jgi:hypothetical protein